MRDGGAAVATTWGSGEGGAVLPVAVRKMARGRDTWPVTAERLQ